MKYKAKSMMSLNEMAKLAIDYEGDGYVTGYPIVSGDDAYILNGMIEANEEYITINQWVPVFPESIETVSPSLTDDQQVVLEMLKEETIDRGNPYAGIYWLLANDEYPKISNKEFYQVLAAFAEWGSKEKQS